MSSNHSNQNKENSDIIIELEIIEEIIKDIALNDNKTYKFIEIHGGQGICLQKCIGYKTKSGNQNKEEIVWGKWEHFEENKIGNSIFKEYEENKLAKKDEENKIKGIQLKIKINYQVKSEKSLANLFKNCDIYESITINE